MIVHDVQQGSDEWHRLRCGIPTASRIERALLKLKKDGEPTAASEEKRFAYMCELAAEWALGEPLDAASRGWMERGRALEDEAIAWYEADRGVEVQRVGFVTDDQQRWGCSPDGLVGDDGGVEVKVPKAGTHIGYLLQPERLAADYQIQVQSSFWIAERKWWDLISYCPAMMPVVVRVERDEELIAQIAADVQSLVVEVDKALVQLGYKEAA